MKLKGEGKSDHIARIDSFGAANFRLERKDIRAGLLVGKNGGFPRSFADLCGDPYRAESPLCLPVFLSYFLRALFIDVCEKPRGHAGIRDDFRAEFVRRCHATVLPLVAFCLKHEALGLKALLGL